MDEHSSRNALPDAGPDRRERPDLGRTLLSTACYEIMEFVLRIDVSGLN